MPLTAIVLTSVSPRGGYAASVVTVMGSGFGILPGTVKFEPLGANMNAAIVYWDDSTIVFAVPAGLPTNRTLTVQIIKLDGSDFATTPFWSPASIPVEANDLLDYQWPDLEAGTPYQDVDDPRKIQAADYNRVLDRIRSLGSREAIVPRTVDVALTSADENKRSTNTGAIADVKLTLPPWALGARHAFAVTEPFFLKVQNLNAATTISVGVAGGVQKVTVPGGFVRAHILAAMLELVGIAPGMWFGHVTGDWQIDA
jgi:hypothetical protein